MVLFQYLEILYVVNIYGFYNDALTNSLKQNLFSRFALAPPKNVVSCYSTLKNNTQRIFNTFYNKIQKFCLSSYHEIVFKDFCNFDFFLQ